MIHKTYWTVSDQNTRKGEQQQICQFQELCGLIHLAGSCQQTELNNENLLWTKENQLQKWQIQMVFQL